jgi:uncharacterized peroxidase-related enzyme
MPYVPVSKLALVDEETATGETAEFFEEIRRDLNLPNVLSVFRVMALSPATLAAGWSMQRLFLERATLPMSLLYMIHYSISMAKQCRYCSLTFKENCRSVGIDEATLDALINNLDTVNPQRVREVINFAVQCALNPLSLTEADYDRVRDQGVSDEELVEVIGWTALAVFNDTIAEAVKLVDPTVQQFPED